MVLRYAHTPYWFFFFLEKGIFIKDVSFFCKVHPSLVRVFPMPYNIEVTFSLKLHPFHKQDVFYECSKISFVFFFHAGIFLRSTYNFRKIAGEN